MLLFAEKPCMYPDETIPAIENGSMEINGNRVHKSSSSSGGGDGSSSTAIKDGESSSSVGGGYKPGAVAIYHCLPGFILVPLSAGKRVCRRGVWEGNMPACSE